MIRGAAEIPKTSEVSKSFLAISGHGEKLQIFTLASGLTPAIDPAVIGAQPFAGSEHFRSASGQQIRQTRPGVFMVLGSDVEYERVMDDHD